MSGHVFISKLSKIIGKKIMNRKRLSEVGFEPTPPFGDQNAHIALFNAKELILESGALDRSAILT